jgi:putative glutamine amidotransferase
MLMQTLEGKEQIKIAISKGEGSPSYLQYKNWLHTINPDLEIINLFGLTNEAAMKELAKCDGLVLSGGPDVNPDFFGKSAEKNLCEIDDKRDTLEFKAIKFALEKKMPILAICRGMQIFNVSQGGSLITDLKTFHPSKIEHQCKLKDTCFHLITINDCKTLPELNNIKNLEVNTNHHQAVDKLAPDLKPFAYSEDGIIEAYEWINPENKSFLIAVQWHPERLSNVNVELSDNLAIAFLNEVQKYKNKILKNKK